MLKVWGPSKLIKHKFILGNFGEKVFEFHRNFGGPKSSTWAIGEQQFYDFTPLLGTFLKSQLFGGRLSTPSGEIPLSLDFEHQNPWMPGTKIIKHDIPSSCLIVVSWVCLKVIHLKF
jgi:hypothetical protein